MKRTNWINLLWIFLLGLLGLFYLIKTSNPIQWISLKPVWIVITFLLFFLWWIFDSVSLFIILRTAKVKINIFLTVKTMLVGFFFGAITPFNLGAMPTMILYLRVHKQPVRKTMTPLLMKTLINGFMRALISLLLALYFRHTLSGDISHLIQDQVPDPRLHEFVVVNKGVELAFGDPDGPGPGHRHGNDKRRAVGLQGRVGDHV